MNANGRNADSTARRDFRIHGVVQDSEGSRSEHEEGSVDMVPDSQDSSGQPNQTREHRDTSGNPTRNSDRLIDDESYHQFPETLIYRSLIALQITLRSLRVAGGELERTERRAVGHRAIMSARALLSYIRGGLQRPIEETDAREREIGGGDIIRHLMTAAWEIGIGIACRQVEEVECRVVYMRVERVIDDVFRDLRGSFE
ncbi:hypothetical protein V498_09784 [Pseudogymnoascus sp. VKM F-4517 (FW-2822)]|nr:hypothetical protein V498_09784 [Pseudogymnoascus sp. VKM F-4517 (FW-2822)]